MDQSLLKNINKKDLRLMILDLKSQRDKYLDEVGKLNSEIKSQNETIRLLRFKLEEIEKDRNDAISKAEVLENANKNLTDELQLSTAHQSLAVIIQELIDRTRNKFKKKS